MDEQSEKIQDFLIFNREAYKQDPSAFSALGYDAVYMMKSAIEKSGSTDKRKIVYALKGIEYDGVTGYLTFDDHNNPIKAVTVLKIENGKYIFDSKVK